MPGIYKNKIYINIIYKYLDKAFDFCVAFFFI